MYTKVVLASLLVAFVSSRPQTAGHFRFQKAIAAPIRNPLQQNLPPAIAVHQIRDHTVLDNERHSEQELIQNQNAKYQFSSDVEDHINDLTQQRSETRDGLLVKGVYSYSDGYFKRTVNYEADENGYRVTGMEAIPLEGPKIDLRGTAVVQNAAHGTELKYQVVSVPVEGPVSKVLEGEQPSSKFF